MTSRPTSSTSTARRTTSSRSRPPRRARISARTAAGSSSTTRRSRTRATASATSPTAASDRRSGFAFHAEEAASAASSASSRRKDPGHATGCDTAGVERRWAILPALIAVTVAAPGSAPTAHAHPAVRPLEAAFSRESYAPGSTAQLQLPGGTQLTTLQLFRSGPESAPTRARDGMRGVAVDRRRWVGTRPPGSSFAIRIGNWPSGLYFARLTAKNGAVAFAPFVLRPRRLGEHRVAVVLPTQTWQAYNFRDDDGDGRADTWYAGNGDTARLARPFLDRGVPPHFRHYDLPFLHWIARTSKPVEFLSDADLNRVASGSELAGDYDLIVFSGHHEYVTTHEYDVIEEYRDLGGNLMFLSANAFFWRITIHGHVMTRT